MHHDAGQTMELSIGVCLFMAVTKSIGLAVQKCFFLLVIPI
jgi:hypothetical protein